MVIDSEMAATKIIKRSCACISMPFTSTALMAKLEGKPSVYYDPSGLVQKNDRSAHGVPILTGVDELNHWAKTLKICVANNLRQ